MRVDVLQENLVAALTHSVRIVSGRNPISPILNNLLLRARDGILTVVGSDGEITVVVNLGVKTNVEGEICLPARQFFDLVSSLKGDKLTLEVADYRMTITAAGFQGTILGSSAEDFPYEVQKKAEQTWQMAGEKLLAALDKLLFCVSPDDARPALTGVCWQFSPFWQMAATDLFRLSVVKLAADPIDREAIIVPAKGLRELAKTIGSKKDTPVKISLSSGEICFQGEEVEVRCRLIAATYPNFEKIIPEQSRFQVLLPVETFARAIKTAAVFGRENSNIIKITVKEEAVIVSSNAAQLGQQENEIEAKLTGEIEGDFQMAFNYHYLLDLLANLPKPEVSLGLTAPLAPAVFRLPDDSSFVHLVMPFRT